MPDTNVPDTNIQKQEQTNWSQIFVIFILSISVILVLILLFFAFSAIQMQNVMMLKLDTMKPKLNIDV